MNELSVFSKIINGDIPAYKIYEDDRVVAILDIHPINPGHTLVIPKKQIENIWDLDDEDYHYLCGISKILAERIMDRIKPPKVGVIVEGFGVPHAHVHLIPIYYPEDIKRKQDLDASVDNIGLEKVFNILK
jgi:histidine triad (HIT) family protein